MRARIRVVPLSDFEAAKAAKKPIYELPTKTMTRRLSEVAQKTNIVDIGGVPHRIIESYPPRRSK